MGVDIVASVAPIFGWFILVVDMDVPAAEVEILR